MLSSNIYEFERHLDFETIGSNLTLFSKILVDGWRERRMSALNQQNYKPIAALNQNLETEQNLKKSVVKCYGYLRIWRYRTSSLNTEISIFGTERVKNLIEKNNKNSYYS